MHTRTIVDAWFSNPAKNTVKTIIGEQGWNDTTVTGFLLEFITNSNLQDEFAEFLEQKQQEESGDY